MKEQKEMECEKLQLQDLCLQEDQWSDLWTKGMAGRNLPSIDREQNQKSSHVLRIPEI